MLKYLQSFFYDEEKEIQADEKQKRLKYMLCVCIKKSNFKLRPPDTGNLKIKKPLLHTRPKRPLNLHTIL
jgi:hypothetical protein